MRFPTDKELFPALFDPAKQKGRLKEAYAAELERCWQQYIDSEHRQTEAKFSSYSNYSRYEHTLWDQADHLWDHMDCWLAERLKQGNVDSFPATKTTLVNMTAYVQETEINESGREKQAANIARKAAVKSGMEAYRESLDNRERAANAFIGGTLFTDEELAAQGKLNADDYGTGKMYRDMKELDKQHELENEYEPEALDSDDYDTTVNTYTTWAGVSPLHMVDTVAYAVESKYVDSGRYMHYSTLFKLLDPLYVVAHEKEIKKQLRSWPLLAIPLLAVALYWITKNVIIEGVLNGILSFVSTALFFCTFCGVGILLILLFSNGLVDGLRTIFSLFIPSKKGSSDNTVDYKKCKKQAQENLPEIYRRLRFYTLWAKQSGNEKDVERIQKIFDDYMKASGN